MAEANQEDGAVDRGCQRDKIKELIDQPLNNGDAWLDCLGAVVDWFEPIVFPFCYFFFWQVSLGSEMVCSVETVCRLGWVRFELRRRTHVSPWAGGQFCTLARCVAFLNVKVLIVVEWLMFYLWNVENQIDLKEHLSDVTDYVLVPKAACEMLVTCYGIAEGQEIISREVTTSLWIIAECLFS